MPLGGGYRAMPFHTGVLLRLNETGRLHALDRIVGVSGGACEIALSAGNKTLAALLTTEATADIEKCEDVKAAFRDRSRSAGPPRLTRWRVWSPFSRATTPGSWTEPSCRSTAV